MAGEATRGKGGTSAQRRTSSGGVAKSVATALRRYTEEIVQGVPDTTAASPNSLTHVTPAGVRS
jgi:hypothetical protein